MQANERPIPARTLCSAMRRARCAILIASASRSSRSTVSTTSAASRGRSTCGAQRHPDTGGGERGGVVQPVPNHDRLCLAALPADRLDLLRRGALGQHPVDAHRRAHALRDIGAVAGDQHHAGQAGGTQPAQRLGRVRADGIVQQQGAAAGRPRRRRRSSRRRGRPAGAPAAPSPASRAAAQSARPRATDWPTTTPRTPAVLLDDLRGSARSQSAAAGGTAPPRTRACAAKPGRGRRRATAHRPRRVPSAPPPWRGGTAAGERAGLVQQHRAPGGQPLQRAAALDHDAAAGGPGQPGHDRHWCGQQQRARGGDHQHRDRAHRVRDTAQARPAMTKVTGRNSAAYRLASRTNGALAACASGPAGRSRHRRCRRRGSWPAGQTGCRRSPRRWTPGPRRAGAPAAVRRSRGLVQGRGARLDPAVHRDDLTRLDEQQVPGPDRVERRIRRRRPIQSRLVPVHHLCARHSSTISSGTRGRWPVTPAPARSPA